ncbi:Hsp20/alpha crystallin family protein [Candidatus Berkelbacteria bacterium]|nr:Hsp20/alpha crystallin family protein [Candidatus Berkelbacteria bacterium]
MGLMTDKQTTDVASDDWLEEDSGGQLAIDAYQTEDSVVIKAPIAGVLPENLDIAITDDMVTIKGERQFGDTITRENYFVQECYWGSFSRSYVLPTSVDADNANADLKNGILTITIPKLTKTRARRLTIKTR